MEFSIKLNGEHLLAGDETSCRVVFNCLSGRNFQTRPLWQTLTYEDYLAYMGAQHHVRRWQGEITLHDTRGEIVDDHEFVPPCQPSDVEQTNVIHIGSIA